VVRVIVLAVGGEGGLGFGEVACGHGWCFAEDGMLVSSREEDVAGGLVRRGGRS
jgi:hypothetical protein